MSVNLFSSSVSKAWSDNARQKSAEARRGRKHPPETSLATNAATYGGYVGGSYLGARYGGKAVEGVQGASVRLLEHAAHEHRDLIGAVEGTNVHTFGSKGQPPRGAAMPKPKGGATVTQLKPGGAKNPLPSRTKTAWLGRAAIAAGHLTPPGHGSIGAGLLYSLGGAVAGGIAGAYGAYRGAQAVQKFNDTEQRDDKGKWSVGASVGSIGGAGAAIYNAGRIARHVNRGLKRLPARANGKPRVRRLGRAGVAGLAVYGAVRGGAALGGYIGDKIDQATSRVFKDWSKFDESRQGKGKKKGIGAGRAIGGVLGGAAGAAIGGTSPVGGLLAGHVRSNQRQAQGHGYSLARTILSALPPVGAYQGARAGANIGSGRYWKSQ